MITERILRNDDPDDISNFLSEEYGIDWAAVQAIDGVPIDELPEPTVIEESTEADDPDDVAAFLGEHGIDWDAIATMDFSALEDDTPIVSDTQSKAVQNAAAMVATTGSDGNDYNRANDIPIIAGEAMYEALKTAALPPIRPLELHPEVASFLDTPITDARSASFMRRYVQDILKVHSDELHINDDVMFQARLGLSEALQNALRHGGGARRVILGVTPYNNIFIGVENLVIDNVDEFHTFRRSRSAEAVGNAALGLGMASEELLTADQHSRGLFLMAINTVNGLDSEGRTGLQKNRTISAGLCSLPVDTLRKLSRGQALSDSDMQKPQGELLRTISWGVYGYDTEAAREADAAITAV